MSDPVHMVRFGDGDPACLHCQIAAMVGTLVEVQRRMGTPVSAVQVMGALLQIVWDLVKQAPEADRYAWMKASVEELAKQCGYWATCADVPAKESMN